MSAPLNIYELLVDKLGEDLAFKLCEEFGGLTLDIPKKAHKTHRVRVLVDRHIEIIDSDEKRRAFVKIFSKELNLSSSVIYKIIKENKKSD